MKDLRTRILVSVSLVVGISIALLLYYIYVYAPSQENTFYEDTTEVSTDGVSEEANGEVVVPQVGQKIELPPVDQTELYLKQLSRDFVEKFGTYSSQNRNKNIEDVLPLVTSKMSIWLENQKIEYQAGYNGATTKVVVNTIKSVEDTLAVVSVGIQQVVSTKDGSEILYKNGDVHLLKQGETWKIDGLYWEE
ncbi:MAG: hypothetical protein COX81_03095 [Candidatus Magasanikbacteria bacterium CG_4_10_14_0_2_um_filter_37_12]|uniref:Uncharacterized protein n=1 Tax=Candidatus Magasanikbacteria bacterium CG_4_10_14_0_2_um_filter_37_12 TaxID=1974637 RepID=A0A2M7V7A0_9BACT|nr:MAG: hypothetical protein COX81_03095 [Candidatus Magasanikbacteria bacterium CG_4_10_14_0_2_um_filter_37_12]